MVSKCRYLMLPEAFLDIESYPWYWFYRWSNSSVLCSSCKNTFVGAGNLQVITNKFWCENLWGPYVLYLDTVLCMYSFSFLRLKHIILAADYMKKNYSVNRAGLCTQTQSLVLHEIFTSPDRGWTFQDKLRIKVKATSH